MPGFTYGGPDGATYGGEDGSTYGTPRPRQVENVSIAQGTDPNTELDLSWDAAGSAEEYAILRAESSGTVVGDYTEIDTTTALTYTDSGLENGEEYFYRVVARNKVGDGDPSAEVTETTDLPPTEITTIDTSVEGENTLSLNPQDNSSDGGIDIYRSTDGSLGTTIVTGLAPSTTSYTDTDSILDGQEYFYTARRNTDHVSVDGAQVNAVSFLPDEDQPILGNGIEDEVAVDRESAVSNNGSVRYQIRETGETSWDSNATGFAEFVGDFDTLTFEFVGREDGEEYEVRGRTETDDATGTFTDPVSIVTKFPGATNLTVTNVDVDSVTLEWTDNADNEDGTRIYARKETDPPFDNTLGNYFVIKEIGPTSGTGTVTETLSNLDSNTQYEFYVEPFTEHTSVQSDTVTATTDVRIPNEGVLYLFGERGAIYSDSIVRHNPVHTHTGKGDFELETPYERGLDEYVQRKERVNVYIDGEAKFTGYAKNISHDGVYTKSNGDTGRSTRVTGDGIAKRLEETRPDYESLGGAVTYTNTALDDAIEDYWGRTPFDNVTVYDQETSLIAEDVVVHEADLSSEWENITELADTTPITTDNDSLELLQTCFTVEGEDRDRDGNGAIAYTLDTYSGGVAYGVDDNGEFIEWDFTTDYTIPESEFGVHIRHGPADDLGGMEVQVSVDGGPFETIDFLDPGSGLELSWRDHGQDPFNGSGYTGGDVPVGTHTIRLEGTGSGDEFAADVVAPADNRYNYFFDNDNGGNDGYLDGPELYPESLEIESTISNVSYNIVNSTISSTINDTTNNQSISVSNDGGDTYTTFNNTNTVDHDYSGTGRAARFKVTLSRYGSRTDATPQDGFNNQIIDDLTHTVDGNSLVVIDSLELTRDHFSNLQTLHEYGSYLWTINHDDSDISNMLVESFVRGSQTKPAPDGFDLQENKTVEVNAENYYNTIYLEGAKDDQGNRPTAEVNNQTRVNEDGRVISPGVLRDLNITTEAGADFRASALLQKAIDKRAVKGTVTAAPELPYAGYARPVDLGDGETNITVEEVSLTESPDGTQAVYDFVDRNDLSREISDLKRGVDATGDQV